MECLEVRNRGGSCQGKLPKESVRLQITSAGCQRAPHTSGKVLSGNWTLQPTSHRQHSGDMSQLCLHWSRACTADVPFQTPFYVLPETPGETTMRGTSEEKAKAMIDHSHTQAEVSDLNLATVSVRVCTARACPASSLRT